MADTEPGGAQVHAATTRPAEFETALPGSRAATPGGARQYGEPRTGLKRQAPVQHTGFGIHGM